MPRTAPAFGSWQVRFDFQKKKKKKRKDSTPGPGTYDVGHTVVTQKRDPRTPAFKSGVSRLAKSEMDDEIPFAEYDVEVPWIKQNARILARMMP